MSQLLRFLFYRKYCDALNQQYGSSDNVAPPQSPGEHSSMDNSPLNPISHSHSLNRPEPSGHDQQVRRSLSSSLNDRRSRIGRRRSRSTNRHPTSAPISTNFNQTSSRHQRHRNRPPPPPPPRREPNANGHRSEFPNDRLRPSTHDRHADFDHQRPEPSSSDAPPSSTHQHPDPGHQEPNLPAQDAAPSPSHRHPNPDHHESNLSADDAPPSPTDQHPVFNHDQSDPHSEASPPPPDRPQPSFSRHVPISSSFNLPPLATQRHFPRDDKDAQDLQDWLLCHSELVSRVNALPALNAVNTAKDLHKYLSRCKRYLHYLLRSNPFSEMEIVLSSHLKEACTDNMALVAASIRAIEAQGSEQTLRCSSPDPTLRPSQEVEFVANAVDHEMLTASTEGLPQFTTQLTAEALPHSNPDLITKVVHYAENADTQKVRGEAVRYRILKRADDGQTRGLHDLELGEAGTSPRSENAGIAEHIHMYDVPAEGVHQDESQFKEKFLLFPDCGSGIVTTATREDTDTGEVTREEIQGIVRQETESEPNQELHGAEIIRVDHDRPKWRKTTRGKAGGKKKGKFRPNLLEQREEENWHNEAEWHGKDEEKKNEEQQDTSISRHAEKTQWEIVGHKVQVESAGGLLVGKARKAGLTNGQRNWERKQRRRQRQREDAFGHGQAEEVHEEREAKRGEEQTEAEDEEKRQGKQEEGEWTTVRRRRQGTPGAKRVFERMQIAEARRAELNDEQLETFNLERMAGRRSRRQPQQQGRELAQHGSKEEDDTGDSEDVVCAGCDSCDVHGDSMQDVCNEAAHVEQEIAPQENQMLESEQDAKLDGVQPEEAEESDGSHEHQMRDSEQDIASGGVGTGEIEQVEGSHEHETRDCGQDTPSLEPKQSAELLEIQTKEFEQVDGLHENKTRDDEQDMDPRTPEQNAKLRDAQTEEVKQQDGSPKTKTQDDGQDIASQGIDAAAVEQDTESQKPEIDKVVSDPEPHDPQSSAVEQVDESPETKSSNEIDEIIHNPKPHEPRSKDAEQINEPPEIQTRDSEQNITSQDITTGAVDQEKSSQEVETDVNVQTPEPREAPTKTAEQIEQPPNTQTGDGEQDIPWQRTIIFTVDEDTSSQQAPTGDQEPHSREAGTGMRPGNVNMENWLRALEGCIDIRPGNVDIENWLREVETPGMRPGNVDIENWLRALEDEEREH